MHISLVISVLIHTALLAWALVTIHRAPDDRPPVVEPVAVAIVTPDDITRLRKGDREAKQMEAEAKDSPRPDTPKKEAPKPTPTVAAPPPPPPEPAPPEPAKPEPPKPDPIAQKMAALEKEPPPAPTPAPGPTPEEKKQLEDKLEQERKAEQQKKLEEQRKKDEAKREADRLAKLKRDKDEKERKDREKAARDKKQKEFNADKLSDLLNKIPDKGAPAAAVEKSETKSKSKGPVAGAPEGRDTRLTASELGLLVRLIKQCVDGQYRRLNGSSEADRLVFDMRIRLNQDGTLVGAPQVMNAQNSPFFLAATENAIRAAKSCEPYQLPPDKYAYWKDVILEFGRN